MSNLTLNPHFHQTQLLRIRADSQPPFFKKVPYFSVEKKPLQPKLHMFSCTLDHGWSKGWIHLIRATTSAERKRHSCKVSPSSRRHIAKRQAKHLFGSQKQIL